MKLRVQVEAAAAELELLCRGEQVRLSWNGQPARTLSVVEAEPGIYSVLMDGDSYEVKITGQRDDYFVDIRGRHYPVHIRDPRDEIEAAAGPGGGERRNVTAPMPGKVVRVLVNEGQLVRPGEGIAVIEAMKMQNEMRAASAGCVVSIAVKPGDTVEAGQTLAVIE